MTVDRIAGLLLNFFGRNDENHWPVKIRWSCRDGPSATDSAAKCSVQQGQPNNFRLTCPARLPSAGHDQNGGFPNKLLLMNFLAAVGIRLSTVSNAAIRAFNCLKLIFCNYAH